MYRVIVADDEPIERMVVEKIIKKNFEGQLEVVLAENGRMAAELFVEKECQIALLDIEMPGVNGLEAAEQIREKNPDSHIVFLTAFDEFSYAKRAISVRALDYLLKPAAEEELIAVLEEAIRLQEEIDRKELESQNSEGMEEDNGQEQYSENLRLHAVADSILRYIEGHYRNDIALQDVAAAMNYSDAYFCKLFKQCFDKSFVAYLTWYRIEKAKEQLEDILVNVKDVSLNVGYRDSNYFTKVFKRMVGVTPSDYRMQVLQNRQEH